MKEVGDLGMSECHIWILTIYTVFLPWLFLVSRLALKIVVGAREHFDRLSASQGTGNTEESFGRFYFSSHTFKFFGSPT
jgi:hypothetical protein